MKHFLLSFIALFAFFQLHLAGAQSVRPDSSFNQNGIVTTNFSGSDDYASAIAVQPDGKVIIVGNTFDRNNHMAMVRYDSTGIIDQTFGIFGKELINFTEYERVTAIKVQPNGKIIVAGYDEDDEYDPTFFLMRFFSNGMPDSSFGTHGTIVFFEYPGNYASSLALQEDGKIIVAGTAGVHNDYTNAFVLMRLNENGLLDSSFGSFGIVIASVADYDYNICNTIAIEPDGKIIAGGAVYSDALNDGLALMRFNQNGTIDSSFGSFGYVTKQLVYSHDVCSIFVEADSKIIVAGSNSDNFVVARFYENGMTDSTFGFSGIDTIVTNDEMREESYASSAVLQADQKIIVAGYYNGANADIIKFWARFNADGSPDTTFKNSLKFSAWSGGLYLAIQPNGRIFSAESNLFGLEGYDFTFNRYQMDGQPDSSFGMNGEVHTNFSNGDDFGNALGIQSDGKLLVAGNSNYSISDVARYNTDGSLDSSFNATGKISFEGQSADAISIQNDGKLLVAGLDTGFRLAVKRFNADGSLDSSFGKSGTATHLAQYVIQNFGGMALQADGKIVVAGSESNSYSTSSIFLHRFNADGRDDSLFGKNGDADGGFGLCQSLVIRPNGTIVAAGLYENEIQNLYNNQFVVKQFNSNGILDNTFGTDGTAIVSDGHTTFYPSVSHSIAIQPDGKLLLALNNGQLNMQYNSVIRLNSNGTPDLTFGDSGISLTNINKNDVFGEAVLVQVDGKVLLAGYDGLAIYPEQRPFYLIRYNADGTVDTKFGNNGIITTYFSSDYAACNAALLQPDGKVVLAGTSFNGNDNDFAVVRYTSDLFTGIINYSPASATIGYIYPNPVHAGKIILQYELPAEENISLSLLDVYGNEEVNYFANKKSSAGKHTEELAIPADLSNGFYLLLLKTERGNVSIKLDKQ